MCVFTPCHWLIWFFDFFEFFLFFLFFFLLFFFFIQGIFQIHIEWGMSFSFGQGAQSAQFPAGHGWKEVNKAMSQETKCLKRLFILDIILFTFKMSLETYNICLGRLTICLQIYNYIFLIFPKAFRDLSGYSGYRGKTWWNPRQNAQNIKLPAS